MVAARKQVTPPRRRYYEQRHRILIADDNARNLDICTEVLGDDYEILSARNGAEAVDVATKTNPAVILMDLMMPVMDGLQASRKLKQDERTKDIPIIILSAKSMTEDIVEGLDVAEDYIVKPFDFRELVARVRSMVRLKTAQDHIRTLNAQLEELVERRTRQLHDSEKLAIVGQYAAGVVHNLSGALQKVMTSIELARLGGDLHAYLDTAFDGTKEMREIISTILDKGRNEQRLDSTTVNINDVLTTTLRFWEADAAFKHGVEKILDLDPALPAVEAVYAHWSQSFDNLLSNAMAAMADTEVKQLSIRTEFGDQSIRIEIQDTGHGMDEATLERIFDPFFTTRSDGLGTGLGLASVKALLEPYGVAIGVASNPGHGTRFELTLPLVDNTPDAPVSPPQASRRRLRRAGDGAASG